MNEMRAHTLVALLTVSGCFAIMIISLMMNRVIPEAMMTLIAVSLSAVLAWYFGVRGTALGAATATRAHTAEAESLDRHGGLSGEQAVRMMELAGREAPPETPAGH